MSVPERILVACCDRERRYRFVNEAYAKRFGLAPADLVGRHIADVLGRDAFERVRAYVDRALAGEALEFEAEVPYETLGSQSVHVSYVPHREADGRVEEFVAVVLDVTGRKRIESELRESRDVLETVNRVGRTVAAELELDQVVQHVTDAATQLTGAQFGAFFYNRIDEKGESYMLYALSGVPRDTFAKFAMPRNTAVFAPTFAGTAVIRLDDVTKDPRYGRNAPQHGQPPGHLPVTSYLAVPVVSRSGEVHGGLFFGHPDPGVFTEHDERLVVGLAAQAAIAIDNARLYEAERRARQDAESARQRLTFIAEASATLAASLDYTTTLKAVGRLAVGVLGDYCVVDVLAEGAEIRRLVATHADPAKQPLMNRLGAVFTDAALGERTRRVLETGEPDVLNDLDPGRVAAAMSDAARREVVAELAPTAYMVLPLRGHTRTFGTMSLAWTTRCRRYGRADVALGNELARRAGVAIENARLHEAQQRARVQAEAANRAKDEFLSVVSHELRTPLSSMLGWVHVLRTDQGARVGRAVDTLERSIKIQRRLTEDLVDVSRIVSGRLGLEIGPVDVRGTVAAVVDGMRIEAASASVELTVQVPAGPLTVAGDPERLQQIAYNLISNAVKFTPPGGRVSVRLDEGDGVARLVVADTGEGIRADFLPHVFERFRQAESVASRRRQRGGLGLGLAIAHHLVTLHGGKIRAESEGEGRGATFTVELPLGTGAATRPANRGAVGASPATSEAGARGPSPRASGNGA